MRAEYPLAANVTGNGEMNIYVGTFSNVCPPDLTTSLISAGCGILLSVPAPAVSFTCGSATYVNYFNVTNDASDTYPIVSLRYTGPSAMPSGTPAAAPQLGR
jgi:hypothetical protein